MNFIFLEAEDKSYRVSVTFSPMCVSILSFIRSLQKAGINSITLTKILDKKLSALSWSVCAWNYSLYQICIFLKIKLLSYEYNGFKD